MAGKGEAREQNSKDLRPPAFGAAGGSRGRCRPAGPEDSGGSTVDPPGREGTGSKETPWKGDSFMRYIGIVAILGFILASAGPATATPVDGTFGTANSWTWNTGETYPLYLAPNYNYTTSWDLMQFRVVSGSNFEQPNGMTNFDPGHPTWHQVFCDGTTLQIAGTATNSTLWYTFNFNDPGQSTLLNWQAYLNGNIVENIDVTIAPSGSFSRVGGTWQAQHPIPEPVTMAGLMLGIGGLVTYVRKRRTA